jgi:hypothetical protein
MIEHCEQPRSSRSRWVCLAITFAFLAIAGHAIGGVVEINDYVDYLRVRNIAESVDELGDALASRVLIVDLRYVESDASATASFGSLLARNSFSIELDGQEFQIARNAERPEAQLALVLVNGETSGALGNVVGALQTAGDVTLIGSPTASGVSPDLSIEVDPDTEKAAYMAFESGTPLSELLDAPVEKTRYDEALLLREFDGTSDRPKDPTAESADESTTDKTKKEPEPPPLVDRTLQRAVNTAIALKALRKI